LAGTPQVFAENQPKTNLLFQFYKKHISVVDGDRCPMAPSCSEYARTAFETHGLVLGWVMTCDRLVRCGRDEIKLAPTVVINNKAYAHDPLAANDFWWFTREPALD
jgi:putative component of membrane protein insertase Oxa1/YidC/SpoIIIJ protein YidD